MISACVTVRNRAVNLARALTSLAASLPSGGEIVITDWLSTDADVAALARASWRPGVSIGVHPIRDTAFSRGRGLNIAAQHAVNDTLLFTDADILFTSDAINRGLAACAERRAWFPVCSAELEKGGRRWRENGKGIVMCTKNMFNTSGRWDEFTTWGMEDRLFFEQVAKSNKVLREHDAGVVHMWHPYHVPRYERSLGKVT